MAKVIAAVPDLLFGSKLHSSLCAAGFECELIADCQSARAAAGDAQLLVVDLTDADFGGVQMIAAMVQGGEVANLKTLGYYSHVEPEAKASALAAGFDLVVPRSRINREGASLASALLAS